MLQACILSVIAGYADTVGYLRYDAFAGLMTGNTVLLGIALAHADPGRAFHYGAIIAFFFSGVLTSRALLRFGVSPANTLVVTAAVFLLASFAVFGEPALVLAFAMGTQNAAATRFGSLTINTVFITGNLQKFGEGVVALLLPGHGHAAPAPRDVATFGLVWLGYAVGAALGAIADRWLPYPFIFPAAILPFALRDLRRLPR